MKLINEKYLFDVSEGFGFRLCELLILSSQIYLYNQSFFLQT